MVREICTNLAELLARVSIAGFPSKSNGECFISVIYGLLGFGVGSADSLDSEQAQCGQRGTDEEQDLDTELVLWEARRLRRGNELSSAELNSETKDQQ